MPTRRAKCRDATFYLYFCGEQYTLNLIHDKMTFDGHLALVGDLYQNLANRVPSTAIDNLPIGRPRVARHSRIGAGHRPAKGVAHATLRRRRDPFGCSRYRPV